MMRRIAALMALCASAALALPPADPTNPCAVPDPRAVKLYADQFDGVTPRPPAFNCMPEMSGGTGKGLTVKMSLSGVMAYWYCPDASPATRYAPNWGAATWGAIKSGDLKPSLALSDSALTPIWCPYQAAMYAETPIVVQPPGPGSWITSGRTTYNSTGGKLGSYAGLASAGLVCNCAAPIKVGALTYCTFAGAASTSIVAQCVKQ